MIDVLYLDNHLFFVNKPPGVLVQADRTGDIDLLTIGKAYIKERFEKPGAAYLGLVHRLDRPASGVMVFARTSKAAARLSEQFRMRTVDKHYMALVQGYLEGGGIARDRIVASGAGVRVADYDASVGKPAEMQWRAVAAGEDGTLIVVQLKTGRKHQIRVQLARLGHPILGDFRYGATQPLDGKNLALHCYRLGIEHPTTGERLTVEAHPPWKGPFKEAIRAVIADDT